MAGDMPISAISPRIFDAEPVHVRVFLLDVNGLHKSQCRG
jgi:hypothetical protein